MIPCWGVNRPLPDMKWPVTEVRDASASSFSLVFRSNNLRSLAAIETDILAANELFQEEVIACYNCIYGQG